MQTTTQRKLSRRLAALVVLALAASGIAITSTVPQASAASGDLVASVNFQAPCASGIGVGIAYDGAALWYSCYASTTDLIRADPTTGLTLASYTLNGGLGALSYDATRNGLWAGSAGGASTGDEVYFIQLDVNMVPTSFALAFHTLHFCGIDDGIAFDANDENIVADDIIYYSDDCANTIYTFDLAGTQLSSTPSGVCHNSGVAVGGSLLYVVDNCSNHQVFVRNKADNTPAFDFVTAVPGDPNFRTEDLECDTHSFAVDVMWGVEAFEPRRAHAFEIPADTCGSGGVDPDPDTGRFTGGGNIRNSDGRNMTLGLTLHCDAATTPNSLQVNWGPNAAKKFHLTSLTTSECSDDPAIDAGAPAATFDTIHGTGTGKYNKDPGATAEWWLSDAGEPGRADWLHIIVKNPGGATVLDVQGTLSGGNFQAHEV